MEANRRSSFGTTLRQLREAAGLSQEQLAERAGLSSRGISDLERGLRLTPRLETVSMLADGLGLAGGQREALFAARNNRQQAGFSPRVNGPSRLPTPPTSFVGREEEIEAIIDQLENQGIRLLTLLGPGGVGKTRIAIEVAHRLADSFGEGALFVDLASVRSPDLLLPAIADRLGVAEQADQDLRESLFVALDDRHLLLVLDNLEQVVEAATDIAWLHASFPELVVITTSRVRLHVTAEQVMPIEPLALPADDEVNTLQHVDAVSLFLARARAVEPRFSLNNETALAIADIVRKLQGMPLAIELAAARIRMLPVSDLLKRLETQLSFLGEGARDAPARQRTMRDTIAWSYNLLSPTEQAVFRALAIFPDGCTLETAVSVCGVGCRFSDSESLDAVEALVDSSMLRRRDGADGQVRFRMLQTLQEFGLEQLTAAGEETIVRQAAHAAWAVPLARTCETLQSRPESVLWLNRIEADQQNLRHHQTWLIANDYVEDALDISGSLAPFRSLRAQLDEGRRELEMLLAHPLSQNPTRARVRAYSMLGFMCMNQGDTEQALVALQLAMALARQLDERWYLAQALILTGAALCIRGQIEESEARAREGLAIATELNSTFLLARGAGGLAMIFGQRGELQSALEMLEKALAISQSIGNPWGMALCMNNLAYTRIRDGEIEKGEALLLDAQTLLVELGDKRDLPGVNLNLAILARLRGDLPRATQMMERSLTAATQTGNMYDIAYCNLGLAPIARLQGDLDAAWSYANRAITWFERCGNVIDAMFCLVDVADILIDASDHSRAAWCLGALDGMLSKRGIARADSEAAERQARVDSVRSVLSDDDWQSNYDRAYTTSEAEILAEVKSWHP